MDGGVDEKSGASKQARSRASVRIRRRDLVSPQIQHAPGSLFSRQRPALHYRDMTCRVFNVQRTMTA